MRDIHIFADETGDLGYNLISGSQYFGFGTVALDAPPPQSLWSSFQLRCELEARGFPLKDGFHARNDRYQVKAEVFNLISQCQPIFDFTFFNKANALDHVRAKGDIGLYKLAWYLHFKFLAARYESQDVRLIIIVADIQTKARKSSIRSALQDVTDQFPQLNARLLVWNSSTSWGLQMVDYGTWSAQRILSGRNCEFWEAHIKPVTMSFFKPWG